MPSYLLLIRVDGVERSVTDSEAHRIDNEYMERYAAGGGKTMSVLQLAGDWHYAVYYQGPEESATWLEDEIRQTASGLGGSAETLSMVVEADITSEF